MSVFLMGCYDPRINKWCTVTKVLLLHENYILLPFLSCTFLAFLLEVRLSVFHHALRLLVFIWLGCFPVMQVHTGHDDAALARLQKELDMVKISQDADRVPNWLKCTKTMVPDFVAADPKV